MHGIHWAANSGVTLFFFPPFLPPFFPFFRKMLGHLGIDLLRDSPCLSSETLVEIQVVSVDCLRGLYLCPA